MRPDMAKVVTEKPRSGHSNKSAKTGKRLQAGVDPEDDFGPSRHPIARRRQYGSESKEFTDLLGPLRAYLRKQVGRPWNKVHSELSKNLDRRSVTGIHIWDHVDMEVNQDCVVRGDKVMRKPRYGGTYIPIEGLYVNPLTGLLCYAPYKRWRFHPKVDPNVKKLDASRSLERRNGLWFLLTLTERVYEYWTMNRKGEIVAVQEKRIAKSYKQLNRKELKLYGVANGAN